MKALNASALNTQVLNTQVLDTSDKERLNTYYIEPFEKLYF